MQRMNSKQVKKHQKSGIWRVNQDKRFFGAHYKCVKVFPDATAAVRITSEAGLTAPAPEAGLTTPGPEADLTAPAPESTCSRRMNMLVQGDPLPTAQPSPFTTIPAHLLNIHICSFGTRTLEKN